MALNCSRVPPNQNVPPEQIGYEQLYYRQDKKGRCFLYFVMDISFKANIKSLFSVCLVSVLRGHCRNPTKKMHLTALKLDQHMRCRQITVNVNGGQIAVSTTSPNSDLHNVPHVDSNVWSFFQMTDWVQWK